MTTKLAIKVKPARLEMRVLESDPGPLGLRTYPTSKYPRHWYPVSLPLSGSPDGFVAATLTVPYPMTEPEWDALVRAMLAVKPGLVEPVR